MNSFERYDALESEVTVLISLRKHNTLFELHNTKSPYFSREQKIVGLTLNKCFSLQLNVIALVSATIIYTIEGKYFFIAVFRLP